MPCGEERGAQERVAKSGLELFVARKTKGAGGTRGPLEAATALNTQLLTLCRYRTGPLTVK